MLWRQSISMALLANEIIQWSSASSETIQNNAHEPVHLIRLTV